MRTIRHNVFETNSSSEHCIAFNPMLRTPDEFPKLTPDGILEIEVKHNWECGEPGTDTSSLEAIIEYLCVLAIHCSPYPDTEKVGNTVSKKQFLDEIKYAYEKMGLPQPTDFYAYFLDTDGNRHEYLGDKQTNWINAKDGDGNIEVDIDGMSHWYTQEEFDAYCEKHPDEIAKCIRSKHCIGINHNLCWKSYDTVTDRFDTGMWDTESRSSSDLLMTRSELYFYRT